LLSELAEVQSLFNLLVVSSLPSLLSLLLLCLLLVFVMEDLLLSLPSSSSSVDSTFQEVSAELIELRPGRLLFVKCIVVGDVSAPLNQGMNVVCIHGTAANHTQYLPLWHAMHQQLLVLRPSVPPPPTTTTTKSTPPSSPSTPPPPLDESNNNDTTKKEPRSSVIRRMTVWLYDGIGCGESPIALPSHLNDYTDDAQVKDLFALLRTKVHTTTTTSTTTTKTSALDYPTILLGHSYGPNLMMKLLKQYPTLAAMAPIVGCIFVSTGVIDQKQKKTTTMADNNNNNNKATTPTNESPPPSPPTPRNKKKSTMANDDNDDDDNNNNNNNNNKNMQDNSNSPLVNGGPAIFKLPLVVLQCLQPFLTASFLRLGFAKATWTDPIHGAALIQAARHECNANNMHVVSCLYRNHQWLTSDEIHQALRVVHPAQQRQKQRQQQRQQQQQRTLSSNTSNNASSLATTTTTTTCSTAENIWINRILPIPRLVVHGAEDSIIPLSCGQYLANQLDTELVVIDHASHAILVEQPKALATSVLTFVQQQILPHLAERRQQQEILFLL
jgi:pimeloyl-ACP methyl ester carboxylesterase